MVLGKFGSLATSFTSPIQFYYWKISDNQEKGPIRGTSSLVAQESGEKIKIKRSWMLFYITLEQIVLHNIKFLFLLKHLKLLDFFVGCCLSNPQRSLDTFSFALKMESFSSG